MRRRTRASETAQVSHDQQRKEPEPEEEAELRVGLECDRRSEGRRHKQCEARRAAERGETRIARHKRTNFAKCARHHVGMPDNGHL
jgi:hypothetical protein